LGGTGESVAVVVDAGELGSATATLLAAYGRSKAALSHVVRILDLELRPHDIRVTVVAPQLLDTSRNRTVFPADVLARCPAGSGRGHHRLPRQRPRRTRQRCGRASLRRLARPHHTLPPPLHPIRS
jgi:NAD(P)-dependent dehydrogenase (short-subunit alcohol dehydrogenase family)